MAQRAKVPLTGLDVDKPLKCCSGRLLSSPAQHRDGLPLLIRSQVRVPYRHRQRAVSQQLPYGVEIDVGLDPARGEVVTQAVPAELLDLRCFYSAVTNIGDRGRLEE
jgi:hypothetical protein